MLAYLSLWRSDLNRKERSYITISSFPKATVQVSLLLLLLLLVMVFVATATAVIYNFQTP